jgi:hypothetical protein
VIRETITIKARGTRDSIKVESNEVAIVITGRADLDRAAKMFEALAKDCTNESKRTALYACANGCRARKHFKITLPTRLWQEVQKGGV